VKSVAVSEIYL